MNDTKAQTEILMNELVGFAEKMLSEYGEFHPFGGYLTNENLVVHVGVDPKVAWEDDESRAAALVGHFRNIAHADSHMAFGIAKNVTINLSDEITVDAINVFLEHSTGYCADVFLHYVIKENGIVDITNITAQQAETKIFSDNFSDAPI